MAIPKYVIRKESVDYALVEFDFERESSESVDQTPFVVSKSTSDFLNIGDDVSIGYYNGATFVPDFSGDIVEKAVNETGVYVMESYGGRTSRAAHFSRIWNNVSPESIAEDIINDYVPSLTYASTATSGVIVEEFTVKDSTPAESINRLVNLLLWQVRSDNDKNYYFEPQGTTINPNALVLGTNSFLLNEWNFVPGSIINSLTFLGGSATFNTTETFTATSGQTSFVVANSINGTIKVTQNGTELLGGVDGSTDNFDYLVSSDNKTISFVTGATVSDSIAVNYNYEVPIKITAENDASIDSNVIFSSKITEENITTMSDARKRVGVILDTYGDLSRTGMIQVPYNSDYLPGQTVTITDAFNDLNITLVITKTTLSYPSGARILEVGTPSLTMFSWQQGIDGRLLALEQKQNNSDRIQQYKSFKENVNINVKDYKVTLRVSTIGNSTIVGSSTNGIVGPNTNTQNGLQQVVGGSGRVETVYEYTR